MEIAVKIPEGADVKIEGFKVSVSGKRGRLEKDFFSPLFAKEMAITKSGTDIKVTYESGKRKIKSQTGGVAAHIRNMLKGVTEGYTAKLKVVFMHFPVTVKVTGNEVTIANFLGEKAPRRAEIIGDTKVEVKGDEIMVTGMDKEAVGQTAANIEIGTRVPHRDRRVFQDGIFATEKAK